VVLVLATLDQLQARTVDLTELDVARVVEGQVAVVTVDALPDVELRGRVARIELQSEDYRGDVTYPVYVELEEGVAELRWGMTAMVEIEVD
jgi:HlyD family secretion protein